MYQQEIDYIFNRFPSFQKVGGGAYKPGIESIVEFLQIIGNPQEKWKSIHVAGTNGKGSTSHMLCAALMQGNDAPNKLKVGLYTSPHLVDFRERVKINGQMVPKEYVYNFIVSYKKEFERLQMSFFEITTALAFKYFADEKVDIAIIECGLGGRLDSTNVITPLASIITNIGLDHTEFLGSTIHQIAKEKGGIIKPQIPVIIGERGETAHIFAQIAKEKAAPIYYAEEIKNIPDIEQLDLKGDCQKKNIKTVLQTLAQLPANLTKNADGIQNGIKNAAKITGLRGRWETLNTKPLVICDTGHNAHGFALLKEQIERTAQQNAGATTYMIFGVVADKDLCKITDLLPRTPYYYFVNASGARALPAQKLGEKLLMLGFTGEIVNSPIEGQQTVTIALQHALSQAKPSDFIFIGGSTFVVAEILEKYTFKSK